MYKLFKDKFTPFAAQFLLYFEVDFYPNFVPFLKRFWQYVLLSDNWDLRSWRVLVLIQVERLFARKSVLLNNAVFKVVFTPRLNAGFQGEKLSCFNHPRADCKGLKNSKQKRLMIRKSKDLTVFFEIPPSLTILRC